jgi:hypothetical protein
LAVIVWLMTAARVFALDLSRTMPGRCGISALMTVAAKAGTARTAVRATAAAGLTPTYRCKAALVSDAMVMPRRLDVLRVAMGRLHQRPIAQTATALAVPAPVKGEPTGFPHENQAPEVARIPGRLEHAHDVARTKPKANDLPRDSAQGDDCQADQRTSRHIRLWDLDHGLQNLSLCWPAKFGSDRFLTESRVMGESRPYTDARS